MNQPIENEPAYRLGRACAIIEQLLGVDEISKQFGADPKLAKQAAKQFLKDELKINPRLLGSTNRRASKC